MSAENEVRQRRAGEKENGVYQGWGDTELADSCALLPDWISDGEKKACKNRLKLLIKKTDGYFECLHFVRYIEDKEKETEKKYTNCIN